ncbi:DUF4386 domain-containing protein, partial [bacterium]|nr:DUF4386 domain-containing protein [bacterium]
LFLELFEKGVMIDLAFFSIHLILLGYLLYRSRFLPAWLGILIVIAGFGYMFDSFAHFLVDSYSFNLAMFTFWGELILTFWLLIKGVDIKKWKEWD